MAALQPDGAHPLIPAVQKILADLKLQPGSEHPCPYLGDGSAAGQQARETGFFVEALPPGFYHALMDLGYRRSGRLVYRPQCRGCTECRQIRAAVAEFTPDRSQRRCWKKNRDIDITVGPPEPTAERHALYQRYLAGRHDDGNMSDSYESFCGFLYETCVDTREACFRIGGKLVGVSILDAEPEALSAVYCFFEPDLSARSLGTFNLLWSIEYARREKIPWYYMGFYIAGCRKMNYKPRIQPCEALRSDGTWERLTKLEI